MVLRRSLAGGGFDAAFGADRRVETGEGSLERALGPGARRFWCFEYFLSRCSSPIIGLRRNTGLFCRCRVDELVGVGGADDSPAPPIGPEQVAAAFPYSGDSVLPGQDAGEFQGLDGLGDGAPGAAGFVGDALVAWEAAAGSAVVESPEERLEDVEGRAAQGAAVLAWLSVCSVPDVGVFLEPCFCVSVERYGFAGSEDFYASFDVHSLAPSGGARFGCSMSPSAAAPRVLPRRLLRPGCAELCKSSATSSCVEHAAVIADSEGVA